VRSGSGQAVSRRFAPVEVSFFARRFMAGLGMAKGARVPGAGEDRPPGEGGKGQGSQG
jgi:hypothetical protein